MLRELLEEFEQRMNEVNIDHGTQKPIDGNIPTVHMDQHEIKALQMHTVGRDYIKNLAWLWKNEIGQKNSRDNGFIKWSRPLIAQSQLDDTEKAEASNDAHKISSQWEVVPELEPINSPAAANPFKAGFKAGSKKRGKHKPAFGEARAGDDKKGQPKRMKSTNTMKLISDLKKLDFVEQIVDMHSTGRGTVALVRTVDGEAYEVEVTPSYHGDNFQGKRGVGETASCGATGAGSIAGAAQPMGGVRKRTEEGDADYVNSGPGLKKNKKPPHATMKTSVKTYMGSADKKVGG